VKDGELELSSNVEFARTTGSQVVLLESRPARRADRPTIGRPAAAGPWDDPDVETWTHGS
jgi:hypothetical protein